MTARLCCIIGLLFLTACAAEAEPDETTVVPAEGTVKIKGETPPGVSVVFFPQGSTKGRGGRGITDETGRFVLKYQDGRDGVPPGDYIVLFEHFVMPDGSEVPENEFPADVGAINKLPQKYGHNSTSPFKATVPEGGTSDIEFDLK